MTREEYKAKLAETYPFTAEEQPAGGTLILGSTSSSNLTTTNPFFATTSRRRTSFIRCSNRSGASSPDPSQNAQLLQDGQFFVPGLADYYEIAEDGKTYTFYINANANFHDGTPVTAHDVVMVCDAQNDEKSGSSYTSTFQSTLKSWTAIDDKTFQWETVDVFPSSSSSRTIALPILPSALG